MNRLHSKSSSKCITQQHIVHHMNVYLYNIEVEDTSLMTKQKWNKLHLKKLGWFITTYDYPKFFHDLRKTVWKLGNFNLYLHLISRWFQNVQLYDLIKLFLRNSCLLALGLSQFSILPLWTNHFFWEIRLQDNFAKSISGKLMATDKDFCE